jgi:hypothetical protein
VVRPFDALAPPEKETPVIDLVIVTPRRQSFVGHPGDRDSGERSTDEHQPAPPPPGPDAGRAITRG